MRAIETTGTLGGDRTLVLDTALPCTGRVRVIVLYADNAADSDESVWLRAANANPAFDFLKDPEEDIYSPTDGRPFHGPR